MSLETTMLNRAIRNLAIFALPMAALLVGSVLTAGPASAQPIVCDPGYSCVLENLYVNPLGPGLYIVGTGHNNPLIGQDGDGYDWGHDFTFTNVDSSPWGIIQDVTPGSSTYGECWNTNGTAIGLDSCPSDDTNEYFEFVLDGNYWLIQSYRTGEYIAADSTFGALYFTTGVNDTSLWSAS
jgi:hypothetical protein